MINNKEKEEILIDNINEYYIFASIAFDKGKFNTSVTLYFKSIVALIDLYLLRLEGYIPSSHGDIFRLLEKNYPDLYIIADRDFPFYQESYTYKMDFESATLLKNDASKLKKILRI